MPRGLHLDVAWTCTARRGHREKPGKADHVPWQYHFWALPCVVVLCSPRSPDNPQEGSAKRKYHCLPAHPLLKMPAPTAMQSLADHQSPARYSPDRRNTDDTALLPLADITR